MLKNTRYFYTLKLPENRELNDPDVVEYRYVTLEFKKNTQGITPLFVYLYTDFKSIEIQKKHIIKRWFKNRKTLNH